MGCVVEAEGPAPVGLARRLFAHSSQDGVDPGDQLFHAEGFGEVVVAADGEPPDPIVGGVSGGEEHDREVMSGGAELLADLEAVQIGEHDVEDGQIDGCWLAMVNPSCPDGGFGD